MLKTRIVTAVFLFLAFSPALFYLPVTGWLAFSTLLASLAAWEWGALMGVGNRQRIFMGAGTAAVCLFMATLQPAALGIGDGFASAAWNFGRWFYVPAVAFWLLVVPVWLRKRWPLPKSVTGFALGLLLLLPTWLALVQLRCAGACVLLAVMAAVWLADIGAYFFGCRFGKHKLAPAISPGKSWEGAIGGGFAVIVYGVALSSRLPTFLSNNIVLLLTVLVFFTAISIVGDLFESMLKRRVGLKDSSAILPGHGGVLDRIDSLTSTLPLAALVWFSNGFGVLG